MVDGASGPQEAHRGPSAQEKRVCHVDVTRHRSIHRDPMVSFCLTPKLHALLAAFLPDLASPHTTKHRAHRAV